MKPIIAIGNEYRAVQLAESISYGFVHLPLVIHCENHRKQATRPYVYFLSIPNAIKIVKGCYFKDNFTLLKV